MRGPEERRYGIISISVPNLMGLLNLGDNRITARSVKMDGKFLSVVDFRYINVRIEPDSRLLSVLVEHPDLPPVQCDEVVPSLDVDFTNS